MNLNEEYFVRRNLSGSLYKINRNCFCLVRYPSKTTNLQDLVLWMMTWRTEENHPGWYHFQKSAIGRGQNIVNTTPPPLAEFSPQLLTNIWNKEIEQSERVDIETFEDKWNQKIQETIKSGATIIWDKQEVLTELWGIYATVFDNHVSSSCDIESIIATAKIIDNKTPINEKLFNLNSIQKKIDSDRSGNFGFQYWNYLKNTFTDPKHYAFWLKNVWQDIAT